MLLNKLAIYYGIRDHLTNRAIDNIYSFNEYFDHPSIPESKLKHVLHHIFKEVVHKECDDDFVNAISSIYLRKANWLKDSVWNTTPNRSPQMADNHNVGFNEVHLEDSFSNDSKADLESLSS